MLKISSLGNPQISKFPNLINDRKMGEELKRKEFKVVIQYDIQN